MKHLFVKTLLNLNSQLVCDTAIRNCHVMGLHSFILNKSPKVRLFIADSECVLRQPFNVHNPILTVHAHKHNDVFINLTKTCIIHHLYKKAPIAVKGDNTFVCSLNMYHRLDTNGNGILLGDDYLDYISSSKRTVLHHTELHTVNILGNGKCAWLVVEVGTNTNFEPISYGGQQINNDCYKEFINPIEYIKEYLDL